MVFNDFVKKLDFAYVFDSSIIPWFIEIYSYLPIASPINAQK